MRVGVLGSGSQGNAIAIQSHDTSLLIDCGFGPRSLKQRIRDSGLDLESVTAILLTHEHGDHAGCASSLAVKFGCPVYASAGTLAAVSQTWRGIDTVALESHKPASVGPFTVTVTRTNHDAAEPLAIRVADSLSGTVLGLAYDIGQTTAGLRHLLSGCNCLIVEANHDDHLLRTGPYPAAVRHRIAGSNGHLSNRAAAQLLADLFHPGLETVVLAHVSRTCNSPKLAGETVREALRELGYGGDLLVARQSRALPVFSVLGAGGQRSLPWVG
jgi:phosphoribosyl 1,2-cyclic phosphodiesterase